MTLNKYKKIADELSVTEKQVKVTIELLDEGGTVPFIARYRKEATGSLDEVQIAAIRDRKQQLEELDKRREAILKSMKELEKLTPELEKQIMEAETMTILEDIYLPFKPKRKTKASVAREKGLQGLADFIMNQDSTDLDTEASKYINEESGVLNIDDALSGARDILAEFMAEQPELRSRMRELFIQTGTFHSKLIKGKETEGQKYKDYFDWSEPVKTAPSHRVLALRRAEKEIILTLDIEVPEDDAIRILEDLYIKGSNLCSEQVRQAAADAFKRLIKPSMETEIRLMTKKQADTEAIRVFAENARQLLLAAPVGQKRIMAIDPGFRTGCKLVCLDDQGQLIENTNIYPHNGAEASKEAAKTIKFLVEKYRIEAIAIGNGTAGRETETFVRSLQLTDIVVVMVNESGASIYSASDVAREEFPDKDITVRGAVSIGRRLMDPLAELVKIDPKSIGVGQYQHDVDQNQLQASLDDTVISCVNSIGVELNTASKQILAYISGLGPQLAQNIVEYRNKNGAFKRRSELRQIPRLGDKAFEQAAGFLRIRNAEHPLDSSAVHPERYGLVEQMAKDLNCKVEDLMKDEQLRQKIKLQNYVTETVGLPTLNDILKELAKPGLDPREQFEAFSFSDGINAITDLHVGMTLPGIITNITAFGAFVDIGVHQDGLVHLSQMADKFIKDPNEVVKVSQKVMVRVTEVDVNRKRIALSMKSENKPEPRPKQNYNPAPKQSTVNQVKKAREKEAAPETDIAIKLAALKNKFS
ncbi:MAG: RNA-binding transcriptional accessory protein [Sphingobacteriales bacterium 17-39-43]|uniref:Tex family protein n=1 Tax=Daejeonella sp. TaxID=2805397 RepID=UPI000BD05653|nr:Tex family protein [Daejeonella sp.]OYY02230.1 MAG: RNA-binding transcriptional accessory protein [Sphingobacteriia bacterium 35-40-5]OYZ32825.1 MAG: RNA-binding transcriptional accessory protein [Sphingobacteriales bacterium 16-39-50]OZA26235.1 MAG: RNA-binding transcriptional accessory protein [Sphingobacteriales bacterium 17-39-43]HQS51943.1 Tex family protein [Daejeonella sp.]HQT23179.1 Tex family protein [Daejeonella sp.]